MTATTAVFTPPPIEQFFSQRGQLLISSADGSRLHVLAEVENLTSTPTYNEVDINSKSFPTTKLVSTIVMSTSLALKATVTSLNKTTLALLAGAASTENTMLQTAVASTTVAFSDVAVGDIFDLGHAKVTVTSITDGEVAPVEYVSGTHYRLDAPTGKLEIIALPAGAGDDISVTFTAAAITEADGLLELGPLSGTGIRRKLVYRELGAIGPFNLEATFWDVQLRADGDWSMIGEDNAVGQISLSGKVFATSGHPAGQEYGRIRTIAKS
ncbi:hypothetical protein [Pleomorphomonas carboxyditropha]|uniref:Uncharacterized protein n=1 Tax=Pleomorphomonas carboxyditropha TaxID=2023338 RepID=A0A2G9X2T8_9HYPH|nr:hypothetical protein [Pleomorphomonas carboxyditropha]PIP00681.1 hypothetical protein CJ014_00830 [Pleomorphomonas carboxyditropha]